MGRKGGGGGGKDGSVQTRLKRERSDGRKKKHTARPFPSVSLLPLCSQKGPPCLSAVCDDDDGMSGHEYYRGEIQRNSKAGGGGMAKREKRKEGRSEEGGKEGAGGGCQRAT